MADPAWGATSTDEETARALCAFQHTNPLPIQRGEVPQLSPALGLAAFGYPTHGSFHVVPMSVRRDEAASVLVEMHAPSTVGDEWKQSQQRSIREQIEQQQRELQVQTQQQQQRVMEAQLHHVQTQIQQQMQTQRIQQPPYASGAARFEQMRWAAAPPSFGGGDNAGQGSRVQIHRPGQLYDGGFQPGQQMKVRPTATSTAAPSYASSYGAAGMPASASDGRFQPRQVQQSTQSRLFATSAPQQWAKQEGSSTTSLSGRQPDRTRQFQMQTTQRVMPQQPRQPQPYCPHGVTGSQTSSFRPDNAVLNGLTRHFANAAGPAAGIPTNGAPAGSDPGFIGAGGNNFRCNPAQAPIPAPAKAPMYVQADTQSRPVVPPSGIPIVPGVSLAPPPLRLVTMRDLLNSDDGPTKTNASRGRPRGGKKQRAPPKRPAPKKKRQRMPQPQGDRALQRPTSRIGNLLPNPSTSLAPTGSSPPTPMYLAFMESRAARALEQTAGMTTVGPPIAPTPSSQSQVPSPATQSATNGASQSQDRAGNVIAVKPNPVKRKRGPYKKKKRDAPQNTSAPSDLQHPNAGASLGKQPAGSVQWLETKGVPNVYERNNSLTGLPHSVGVSDIPMEGDHDQRQPAQLVVPQSSLTLETSQNGKVATTPKKRRKAKLPRAGSTFPAMLQQVPTALSALPAVTGSSATNTAVSAVVAQALAGVSDPPPVANRTVVIFCKRDFMRYQAAKIWRKYQEQLKKQGEWREVRVAGKRTRYLNSRYDDEIQRTHRKTYTRSGKPRKTTTQQSERIRGDKQSSSTANPVLVGATSSSLLLTQDHESSPPARKPHEAVDSDTILISGGSTDVSGDHSSDEKLLLPDEATAGALQEQSPRAEEESNRVVLQCVSRDPSNETVDLDGATGAGNASNGSVTADVSTDGESGNLGKVPEGEAAVPVEAPTRGDVAIASESSHGSAEAAEEVEMEAADGDIVTSGALTIASGTHSSDEKSVGVDKANPTALHERSLRIEEETNLPVVRRVSSEPSTEPVGIEVEAKMNAEPSNLASDGDGDTGAGTAFDNGVTADVSTDGGSGNLAEVPEGEAAVPVEAPTRGDVIFTSEPSRGSAEVNGLEAKDGVDTTITDTPAVVDASCSNGGDITTLESTAAEAVSVDVVAMNNPASDSNVGSATETSGTIEEGDSSSGEIKPKSSPADAPEQSTTPAQDENPSSNCPIRDDSPSG